MATSAKEPKSLPLILARELGSNLATPMFLIDAAGTLIFYNEAAELLLGKPFNEVGELPALEFGDMLELSDSNGSPLRRPAHRLVMATAFDGARRHVEATAYPLFGAADDMHGVLTVFWEVRTPQGDA